MSNNIVILGMGETEPIGGGGSGNQIVTLGMFPTVPNIESSYTILSASKEKYNYFFIHNIFASFFKDTLDYFTSYLYPRFEHRIVSTYDKAVQYLKDQTELNREVDMPNLPAIVLNPLGNFLPADGSSGGKQLWRYPNLAPGMLKRIFEPIYQDENVQLHPGFIRMKGEIELLMLTNSFYEYCDLRLYLIQIFGGLDRWIYPRHFTSFIILPDELLNCEYQNEYTKEIYTLDWSTANASEKLVKSTNRNELIFPCIIKPIFKLTGMSDNSTRYGGTDKLADWRVGVSIEYEIEIPSFLVLESDYLVKHINLGINYESTYSTYIDYQVPVNRHLSSIDIDGWGLNERTHSQISYDDATSSLNFIGDYVFKTRYFHHITKDQVDSLSDIMIDIEETISDDKAVVLNSKYGQLNYGDHYLIINDGNTLMIKVDNVSLELGMVIEICIYSK